MSAPVYERNQVYRSPMTGRWYFVPKSKVLGHGVRVVVGYKIDITDGLNPFLLKKWRSHDTTKKATRGR